MADNSKIEWTDATWNPITGCSINLEAVVELLYSKLTA